MVNFVRNFKKFLDLQLFRCNSIALEISSNSWIYL